MIKWINIFRESEGVLCLQCEKSVNYWKDLSKVKGRRMVWNPDQTPCEHHNFIFLRGGTKESIIKFLMFLEVKKDEEGRVL